MEVRRLGQMLVEQGLITQDQLQTALRVKSQTGDLLGETLAKMGVIDEEELARTLANQLGIAFLATEEVRLQRDAFTLISESQAKHYGAMPIERRGEKLVVAMIDPLNVIAIDEISLLTGYPVETVVVTRETFEEMLSVAHGTADEREFLEDLDEQDLRMGELEDLAADSPVVRIVDRLLERAANQRANDLHIEPLEEVVRVRFRVDGVLRTVDRLPMEMHEALIARVKILASLDISERRAPQEGRIDREISGRPVDLRVTTSPTVMGEKVAIRLLDRAQAITSLTNLGMDEKALERYRNLIRRPHGMILVTGPTGSGKTTTLIATLHALNTPEVNIITVEDPVEYFVEGVNQIQVNPKAGVTFANGLKSVLRQDPDIVMIGEIRDGETANIGVRSALTGHLMLSTIHTNDSAGVLTRLIDLGVKPFLVASAVNGALSQRLGRRLCAACREPYTLAPDAPERLVLPIPRGEQVFLRERGCSKCDGTGYKGRVAFHELLVMTTDLREMILSEASTDQIRLAAVKQGMKTLAQDGVDKAMQGLTSLSEVRRVAYEEE